MKINLISQIFLVVLIFNFANCSPTDDLSQALDKLVKDRSLKGLQLQITNNSQIIYNRNIGIKNQKNETIDNSTLFRIASLSKSFAAVGIMQLV